jgi:RHS repeat-associated protein
VPTYSYNPSNELTSTSSGSYTYDNNGNTLTDASGKSYTWDFVNRLTQAVVPGTGTVTFRYDPFGRRIQKSGPLGTTNYLYDGANVLEEVDTSNNVLARYTFTMVIDEPLSMLRSGTTSYYQSDASGSSTSLTNAAGALANTYTYDSYGNLVASTGTITNPFRYTAREFDPETGAYYYRARYYDSNHGRFISEDSFRSSLKMNRYSYVSNRPVSLIDPSGKQEQCKLLSTFTIPLPNDYTPFGRPKFSFAGVGQAEEPSDDPYGKFPTAPTTSLSCLWNKTISMDIWGNQFKRFSWECTYTLMCGEQIHFYKTYWEFQHWLKGMTSTTERVGTGPFTVAPYEYEYESDCKAFGPP